jgi:hypothetical protein
MIRAPTNHEILLAEQNLMRSRRELAAGRQRLGTAFRNALAKPSTLLGVGLAAGAAGYFLFRRPPVAGAVSRLDRWPALRDKLSELRAHLPSFGGPSSTATAATAAAASTSVMGIVLAFAMRYAMQRLPAIGFRWVEQAVRKGAASRAGRSTSPSYGSTPSLH